MEEQFWKFAFNYNQIFVCQHTHTMFTNFASVTQIIVCVHVCIFSSHATRDKRNWQFNTISQSFFFFNKIQYSINMLLFVWCALCNSKLHKITIKNTWSKVEERKNIINEIVNIYTVKNVISYLSQEIIIIYRYDSNKPVQESKNCRVNHANFRRSNKCAGICILSEWEISYHWVIYHRR